MCINRFSHRIRALLQAVGSFARPRNLAIQSEHAINSRARIHRDLPFLPGHVQIHGAKIFASGGLFWQKGDERTEFPACIQSISGPRPKSIAARDVVAFVGNDWVRQNSGLDQLRRRQPTAIANGPQRRIRKQRDCGGFIRADAVGKIDNQGFGNRSMNPVGGNSQKITRLRVNRPLRHCQTDEINRDKNDYTCSLATHGD